MPRRNTKTKTKPAGRVRGVKAIMERLEADSERSARRAESSTSTSTGGRAAVA